VLTTSIVLTFYQPSTCNTYKAIEQANSSRAHLDVTGIGATACCHGFFVPTAVVDFQKGERCALILMSLICIADISQLQDKSIWTTAFARHFHTTWKMFQLRWSCMTSCANIAFTSKTELKTVQNCHSQAPWNSGLELVSSISMAIKIPAYHVSLQVTFQEQSRSMVKL
jgi:hypothetical protein